MRAWRPFLREGGDTGVLLFRCRVYPSVDCCAAGVSKRRLIAARASLVEDVFELFDSVSLTFRANSAAGRGWLVSALARVCADSTRDGEDQNDKKEQ
jgi:hypothetical protein